MIKSAIKHEKLLIIYPICTIAFIVNNYKKKVDIVPELLYNSVVRNELYDIDDNLMYCLFGRGTLASIIPFIIVIAISTLITILFRRLDRDVVSLNKVKRLADNAIRDINNTVDIHNNFVTHISTSPIN